VPRGFTDTDVRYFHIDFQVNHRLRRPRDGRNVFDSKTPFRTGSRRELDHAAAQCLRWAARAKHEEHKNVMLQMANH